ncbi:MAG: hypothetical protein J2P18_19975 [Nocardia sp.]|nr:hypothetical protein [Nocardia sp.]
MSHQLLDELEGVSGKMLRVSDFDVHPGVSADEGEGDQWPGIPYPPYA